MKRFNFILSTIALLSCLTSTVFADNHYYIIKIKRNGNDASYDEATESVKNAIDELVNERMNDIYNIIDENQETYRLGNGQIDEKLNELESNTLIKRNEGHKVYKFINKNRLERNGINVTKRNDEYIPIESTLVSHVAPVLNYYIIKAYLSDDLVDKVRQLDNVESVGKSSNLRPSNDEITGDEKGNSINSTDSNLGKRSDAERKVYYNVDEIKNETGWSNVEVQENAPPHLSLLSQGRYKPTYNGDSDGYYRDYDKNYYYPTSAGKGVDIFYLDDGLDIIHEDFDKYEGTSDERVIMCDGFAVNGEFRKATPEEEVLCMPGRNSPPVHGTMVASVSTGVKSGVAKKANVHMISFGYEDYDLIVALDYIKRATTKPHKTIISLSLGGNPDEVETGNILQDKIDELDANGIIIICGAGNDGMYVKKGEYPYKSIREAVIFAAYRNVITVGFTNPTYHFLDILEYNYEDLKNMEDAYSVNTRSNHGPAVDIIAPGYTLCAAPRNIYGRDDHNIYRIGKASSTATPLVSGVAALIISEHPEIKFNNESMRKFIIDMSVKDGLTLTSSDTPNRFLNNGKKILYDPRKPPIYTVGTTSDEAPETSVTPVVSTTTVIENEPIITSIPVPAVSSTTINETIASTNPTSVSSGPTTIATVFVTSTTYTTITSTFTSIATETVYKEIC